MIKITIVQQMMVAKAIVAQMEEKEDRRAPRVEPAKPTVEFHEIHDGRSDAKPNNGEMVLIRYEDEEDESYDTVYFYEKGTKVSIKASPCVTKVIEKTGFYKMYAGIGPDETDELWFISPMALSHWGRYPKFNK